MIRVATYDDIESIVEIYNSVARTGSDLRGYFSSTCTEEKVNKFKKIIDTTYVLEEDGIIKAFIRMEEHIPNYLSCKFPEYDGYSYIGVIATDPKYFKMGYARQLKEYVSNKMNWVSDVNLTPMLNLASINMNLRCGYKSLEKVVKDYKDRDVIAFTNCFISPKESTYDVENTPNRIE